MMCLYQLPYGLYVLAIMRHGTDEQRHRLSLDFRGVIALTDRLHMLSIPFVWEASIARVYIAMYDTYVRPQVAIEVNSLELRSLSLDP